MRWRTRAGMIRALFLGCAGVVLVIVAVRGLMHHTPAQPQAAHAPAHLYASTANEGRGTLPAIQRQQIQANNSTPAGHLPLSNQTPKAQSRQAHTLVNSASATQQNPMAASELAARFPALAHQAITADPSGGSETQYFLRLGNLLNGTPLAPGTPIGPNADHLARAQGYLDHDDFAAAITQTEQLSGPAARVMSGWLADARSHERLPRAEPSPTRVAQSAPQKRRWPNVMPTEVPPFARESSGPPPSP